MKLLHKNQTTTQTPEEAALEKEYEQKAQLAYIEAKGKQRIKNAELAGQQDADKLANKKPFYQKVLNLAGAVGKDLIQAAPNTNPNVLFNWEQQREPKTKRRRKTKRQKS
jgi:hypothetical protein